MLSKISYIKNLLIFRTKSYSSRVVTFIDRKPLLSFFLVLIVLLGLIVASSFFVKKEEVITTAPTIKNVEIYSVGEVPRISVQAQIRKSGVIRINALASGVIHKLNKKEGDRVKKGERLLSMAANYSGSNPLSAQRQLAQAQYSNVLATYDIQKEALGKQKDIANKTDENSDQMRDINAKSISDTQALISMNQEIINTLDANITTLSQTPGNEAAILSAKQLKTQFTASNNSAKAALLATQQSTGSDKPTAHLSDLTRELTLKQLEIQEKQLDLNKEVSRLQLTIARINESLYFPTAPFSGVIERVMVKEKESITAGTPVMVISQTKEEDPITAIAFVSYDIASRVSMFDSSTLRVGNKSFEAVPSYISSEAVQGPLYAIYYPIPDYLNVDLISDGFITVDIPVGYPNTTSLVPFVPIDAVYQTREKSYVFVVKDNKATVREVVLGQVFGRYVEILSDFDRGEQVILNRNVIEGDEVKII